MKIYNQSIRKLFFKSSCAICKKESEQEICIYCLTKLQDRSDLKKWSNVYYLWEYDNFIRSLISSYKHKNRIRVGKEIEKIITPKIKEVIRREKINRVMIIPISYSRKNKRGFNQVEELLKSGKIPYKNGKKDGLEIGYFKDGKIKYEIPYRDGKREDTLVVFYKSGKIYKRSNFKDGKAHGPTMVYYRNGNIKKKISFKNGERDGFYEEHYENGNMQVKVNFKNGLPDGDVIYYYENGDVEMILTYKDGKML